MGIGFFRELGGVGGKSFAGLGVFGEGGHDSKLPGFEGLGAFEGGEEEVNGFAGIPGHGHVSQGLEGLGLLFWESESCQEFINIAFGD